MACGSCGQRNRTTAATKAATKAATTTTTPAAAAELFEVVKEGRVIYRHRDKVMAQNRRDANPGSHYRKAGTTTPL